ncbi:MAG TPA: cupin domain-containing protein [Solirubrobacteraceae bacterium]|nr:cupin domain-containing protein [Solirubrobacteraceae bacterium]
MKYVRPVDFAAYRREGYEFQVLYNGESCRVIASNVAAGAAAPPIHIHPVDQLYYVIEGEMQVQLGSERFTAGPDTLVYIPAGTPHHNWNEGSIDEFHFEVLAPGPPTDRPVMEPADSSDAGSRPYFVRPLAAGAFEQALPGFRLQRLLRRADGSEHMTLYVGEVQPGGAGPATHVHRFDQFYYVLEGTLSGEIGLDSFTAGRHTLVVLPEGVPHRQFNRGPRLERHIALLVPEPTPGEPWDIGVRFESLGVVYD